MSEIFGDEKGVYAKVIEDSISGNGNRLTTMEIQCHRFVLAEFNTHRAFSRNSASSRAIPAHKQIQSVIENPAIPLSFPREKSGMQGGEELSTDEFLVAQMQWLKARDNAVISARNLVELGVHKSVTNRLLEPFMWHKIIVSSTEWDNFFEQRCSPLAQPEIREVAEKMREALNNSIPAERIFSWHLPYITYDEINELRSTELCVKVSAARCARVSYLTHDGVRDFDKDLDLFDKLVTANPPHWSPLEHVARLPRYAMEEMTVNPGNFREWRQLRHLDISTEFL